MQSSGEIRHEKDESWIRHCTRSDRVLRSALARRRKQSRATHGALDCFVASRLAMTKLAKLTDIFKRFLET
jgi:hypothetical protein